MLLFDAFANEWGRGPTGTQNFEREAKKTINIIFYNLYFEHIVRVARIIFILSFRCS